MSFEQARQIADAVLLEGYVLYPYRASAPKNRFRWPFGVLAPRDWSERTGCEPWWLCSECLVEATAHTRLDVRLRFLQDRRRCVERLDDGVFAPTNQLDVDDGLHVSWDEGDLRELDFGGIALTEHMELELPFALAATQKLETITARDGNVVGRTQQRRHALRGVVRVDAEPIEAERPLLRLRVRVENTTLWPDPDATRDAVLPACLLATHLLLGVSDGSFVSLLDPPPWAAAAADASRSIGAHPVLVGTPSRRDLVLAAPIILSDYPQLAPESPGDLFDAGEIDELLTLRTRLLTDEEKRHARATDPRAAALIDRVDAMAPSVYERLHGTMRDRWRDEMVPRREPPRSQRSRHGFTRGVRVRLRPGTRRTDAQDLLFTGCSATIQAVMRDVEDREVLAVTIDDDPAATLHRWYGRYHYYYADEVEPL